jgi:methionyl aminopeptidase
MCTEKDYSGSVTGKIGKNAKASSNTSKQKIDSINSSKKEVKEQDSTDLTKEQIENYRKAGKIATQIKGYALSIIKPGIKLAEIAEKVESKIVELKGEVAFPVNLSINDIAAHYTPSLRDETIASGLLKIDLGVQINGCICDLAFSIDLTPEKKYQSIIRASDEALKSALELVKKNKANTKINEIGKIIKETIEKNNLAPIRNLCGHGLTEYEIHSGITIPNYDNGNTKELGNGAFAIEPFATNGSGIVKDGQGSLIYHISKSLGQPRDNFAREVLSWLIETKKTLPFSQREVERKFGTRALFALRNLEQAGLIQEYAQLLEQEKGIVSQSETSLIIHDNQVEILVEPQ